MKVRVDENLCIGCGLCASTCEEVFELRDGKSYVIKEDGSADFDMADIADSCPVGAIEIDED